MPPSEKKTERMTKRKLNIEFTFDIAILFSVIEKKLSITYNNNKILHFPTFSFKFVLFLHFLFFFIQDPHTPQINYRQTQLEKLFCLPKVILKNIYVNSGENQFWRKLNLKTWVQRRFGAKYTH